MFSCEFCEISKNTFLHRTPLVAAAELVQNCLWIIVNLICSIKNFYREDLFYMNSVYYIMFTMFVYYVTCMNRVYYVWIGVT